MILWGQLGSGDTGPSRPSDRAYLPWAQEVPGSNPGVPTTNDADERGLQDL